MTFNLNDRKFVLIIPVVLITLLFAGIVGIVATSLNMPNQPTYINETTSILAPDTFDVTKIIIPSDSNMVTISITLQISNIADELDLNNKVDLYYYDNRPDLGLGNNLTALLASDLGSNIIDQDLQVSTFSQITTSIRDAVYLVVANPLSNTEELSVDMNIVSRPVSNSSNNAGYVLSILGAVFFTALMAILLVFSIIEILEPNNYKARFLTIKTEGKISALVFNSESWEIIVVALSLIFLPIGIAMNFAGVDTPTVFFSLVGIFGVGFNIKKRIDLHNSIRNITATRVEIHLDELSRIVNRKKNDVRKAIFYLISHERYPLQFHAKSSVIVYTGSETPSVESDAVVPDTVTDMDKTKSDIVDVEKVNMDTPTQSCAYCGADAIVSDAKFCAECGASMVASK